jgi:hypothetical protein
MSADGVSKMAGFLLESFAAPLLPPSPMKLLDLGGCEITGQFQMGSVRGAWAYWEGSCQWRISKTRDRVVVMEGQPDRYPNPGESIECWLAGRSGSFRGFEVVRQKESQRPKVVVFTDPLGTRPVYLFRSNDRICVSDKLASVALNCGGLTEPDWGGLLEFAALGTLYSHKTTLKDALRLPPGEAMEVEGGRVVRRWKNMMPADADVSESQVRKHPAEMLQFALSKATAETWTDPEMRLLLSGGLDSRILLALASGKRKALTLDLYPDETELAKKVAAVSGAELVVVPVPDYEYVLRWSYLVTGAMHDSRFPGQLGLVEGWRKQRIPGIAHGLFHNMVYRGWTARKFERSPDPSSILFQWMGRNACYFERYGCMPEGLPQHVYDVLSVDGQATLRSQLRELADSMQTVIVDGYDLTFERRLMHFVSRQVYFAGMLGWYEGVDVSTPIFHPAVWSWYGFSRPRDRDRGWAIREVFVRLDHPAAKLPDSNTGMPVAHVKIPWRERVRESARNQIWYPPLRTVRRKLSPRRPRLMNAEGGMRWGARLREPRIFAVMEEAVTELMECPVFDRLKLKSTLEAYRSGDNHLVDAICTLTAIGQWLRVLGEPASLTDFTRVFAGASASASDAPANLGFRP